MWTFCSLISIPVTYTTLVIFRVTVSQGDVNKNLYYVLLAADNEGNIGQMGNIVKAYMPRYNPSNCPCKIRFDLFVLQASPGWPCQRQLTSSRGAF